MDVNPHLIEINLQSQFLRIKKRPIDTETTEKFISRISRSLEELGQVKFQLIQLGLWLWKV